VVPTNNLYPLTLLLLTNSLSPSLPPSLIYSLSYHPSLSLSSPPPSTNPLYDKIETGSLKLEFSMVPVWKVLQRTFKTFVLQAREKEIVFQLQGEMFGADASLLVGDLGNLHCVGDETRITQVLFTFLYPTYWR
jgi:hypothetical protein